jgi:hypothetical protein
VLIGSNRIEAEQYYLFWVCLEEMSWMLYLDHNHLYFVIVAKLAYLFLLEWLEVAHVITLPCSFHCWLLFLKFIDCDIFASLLPCILNSNVISLNFIHLFIMSAFWLLIKFKFLLSFRLHSQPSSNAILTSYWSERYLSCKLQIWFCNHSTCSTFFRSCSSVFDFILRFSILLFRASPEIKLCMPAYYQSLHRILLPTYTKTLAILKLDCAVILGIVTFALLKICFITESFEFGLLNKSCHHFVFYILHFTF